MRTTKTLSITLPPEMLSRAEEIAKQENRTMSELVREALRHYDRQRWWDEMNTYGRKSAAAVGVTSEKMSPKPSMPPAAEKRADAFPTLHQTG